MPLNSNDETTVFTTLNEKTSETVPTSIITSFVPLEKTKRVDQSIQNTTELATSTTSSKPSTIPTRSVQSQTPRITHASETIRARVTSEQLKEKHGKFLSDPHPSTPSTHDTDSWANIKTVDEVNHNNFTLGRTNGDSIKSVNGKIDLEELEKSTVDGTSTERIVDEHETQLQKQKIALNSNSSRIDDQPDNALTPLHSERPTLSVAARTSTMKAPVREEHRIVNVDDRRSSTPKVPESTIVPVTDQEKGIVSTTEAETPTTVTVNDDTTLPDETTTSGTVPNVTIKSKENLVELTEPPSTMQTTTEISETEPTMVTTTESLETTPKQDETSHNIVTRSTTISPSTAGASSSTAGISSSTAGISSSTEHMTKYPSTASHRPFVPAVSTEPKIIENTENTRKEVSTTQRNAAQVLSTSTTTTTESLAKVSPPTEPIVKASSPKVNLASTAKTETRSTVASAIEHSTEIATKFDEEPTDINAMIAIGISVIAVITLILLAGFLIVMRKRQKQLTYGQRCRPIGLDAYSLDNVSVYNSVRRKSAMRTSKRAFGNAGFDDPSLKNNPLNISQLATFSQKRVSINDEFRDIPMVTARIEEVPAGCEDKNR